MSKFKVGDEVVLINNQAGSFNRVGTHGKVVQSYRPSPTTTTYLVCPVGMSVKECQSTGGRWSLEDDLRFSVITVCDE